MFLYLSFRESNGAYPLVSCGSCVSEGPRRRPTAHSEGVIKESCSQGPITENRMEQSAQTVKHQDLAEGGAVTSPGPEGQGEGAEARTS